MQKFLCFSIEIMACEIVLATMNEISFRKCRRKERENRIWWWQFCALCAAACILISCNGQVNFGFDVNASPWENHDNSLNKWTFHCVNSHYYSISMEKCKNSYQNPKMENFLGIVLILSDESKCSIRRINISANKCDGWKFSRKEFDDGFTFSTNIHLKWNRIFAKFHPRFFMEWTLTNTIIRIVCSEMCSESWISYI